MSMSAAYLVRSPEEPREPMDWTPESSRRARGFAVYAALRSLGRSGVADMIFVPGLYSLGLVPE